MCLILEVSKSGFYDWSKRSPSNRAKENIMIIERIKIINQNKNKRVYGSPRIHKDLIDSGIKCSKNRIARLMKKANISSVVKKKWKATTNSKHSLPIARNLLEQNFHTYKIDEVWTSDITYIWTQEGWLYLCVILDIYSRKVIGWSMDKSMKQELVLKAIKQAIGRRGSNTGIIFHSDRGVQYAALFIQYFLEKNGFKQSMSRKGNCYDNAVTESFFHTLKTEHVYFENYKTRSEAMSSIFSYIELFYNMERRHSSLGYISPEIYERIAEQKTA
jgi:transposase InsO family protein